MIPNLITLTRLLLTPVIVLMISFSWNIYPAFFFTIASFTDWLDGWVARNSDSQTEFGKIFDPLTDRIFIASTLVALMAFRQTPQLVPVLLLLVRDALLVAGGQIVFLKTGTRIPINLSGKIATGFLMTAIVLLILGWPIAIFVFYAGLALSYIAAGQYLQQAIRNLKRAKSLARNQILN